MSKHKAKVARKKRDERRAAWERLPMQDKLGKKLPGSLNFRKR